MSVGFWIAIAIVGWVWGFIMMVTHSKEIDMKDREYNHLQNEANTSIEVRDAVISALEKEIKYYKDIAQTIDLIDGD